MPLSLEVAEANTLISRDSAACRVERVDMPELTNGDRTMRGRPMGRRRGDRCALGGRYPMLRNWGEAQKSKRDALLSIAQKFAKMLLATPVRQIAAG